MSQLDAARKSFESLLPNDIAKSISRLDHNTFWGIGGAIVILIVVNILFFSRNSKPVTFSTLNGEWQKFKLLKKTEVSPNTKIYRLALPSERHYLGLPIGQHIQVQAQIGEKKVQRPYTPISSDDDLGWFELMIKTYPKGNISQYMEKLKIGDSVEIKGPRGQMKYSPHYAVELGMMAGGTGITPMLQVIRAAMKDPLDHTHISLVYANVKEEDILLREELDKLSKESGRRFKVHYVLDTPPEGWQYSEGRVTEEIVKDKMPKAKVGNRVHLCGPPPMIDAMKKHLEKLGFEKPNTISKMPDQIFCY